MTVYCTECEKIFSSHDGGTMVGEKTYCPDCEEVLEQRAIKSLKRTWEEISDDVLSMERELGYNYSSRFVVIQMCLDAGRVDMYGNDKDATAYLKSLTYDEQKSIAKQAFPLSRYC